MSKVFKGPSKPKPLPPPDPLPPVPERSDAETAALAEEQRKKFGTARSGRASTFLSGGGLSESSTASRFLGGSQAT